MLVEKLLARSYKNLDAEAARKLVDDLDEAKWALQTLQRLAEEDETGELTKRFARWQASIEKRRAYIAGAYLT